MGTFLEGAGLLACIGGFIMALVSGMPGLILICLGVLIFGLGWVADAIKRIETRLSLPPKTEP